MTLSSIARLLGPLGFAALLAAAAVAAFHALVLAPLQQREAMLRAHTARLAAQAPAPLAHGPAEKVAAVYQFLQREEQPTDWLARLHGIGGATGVEVSSAAYRHQATATPIQRYELMLPVTGTYPQIREFLRRAAAEIPVLSVDQVTLRRTQRTESRLQGELRLTLHMVKS